VGMVFSPKGEKSEGGASERVFLAGENECGFSPNAVSPALMFEAGRRGPTLSGWSDCVILIS